MCWSFEVSVATALIELGCIVHVGMRSFQSEDPWIQQQRLLLPLMVSVCVVELVEALLWLEDNDLVPAVESSDRPCSSTYNKSLTLLIFLAVLPWQPFWVIFPTRRVGKVRNRDLLLGAELLSIVFGLSFVGTYLVGLVLPMVGTLRRPLESSSYKGCFHTETCTFVGHHGRLHWVLGSADSYVTPNIYTYTFLWLPVALARPWRFSAGILLVTWALSLVWLFVFDMSFESGSVWCWSGILLCLYFVLQPYWLPIILQQQQKQPTDKLE